MQITVICKECAKEININTVRELGGDITLIMDTCECGDKKMCHDCNKHYENTYTQTIDELKAKLEIIEGVFKDKEEKE